MPTFMAGIVLSHYFKHPYMHGPPSMTRSPHTARNAGSLFCHTVIASSPHAHTHQNPSRWARVQTSRSTPTHKKPRTRIQFANFAQIVWPTHKHNARSSSSAQDKAQSASTAEHNTNLNKGNIKINKWRRFEGARNAWGFYCLSCASSPNVALCLSRVIRIHTDADLIHSTVSTLLDA